MADSFSSAAADASTSSKRPRPASASASASSASASAVPQQHPGLPEHLLSMITPFMEQRDVPSLAQLSKGAWQAVMPAIVSLKVSLFRRLARESNRRSAICGVRPTCSDSNSSGMGKARISWRAW